MIADVVVSPRDANLVFAAAALDGRKVERDGVYRAQNGGKTWELVHQFTCKLGDNQVNQPVGQIQFAPDDSTQLWAAGGCTVAYSRVPLTRAAGAIGAADTWSDAPRAAAPNGVWHVTVGPLIDGTRAVWACGPSTLWRSTDAGRSFVADDGASDVGGTPASVLGSGCERPSLEVGGAASSSVLVLDPSNPLRAYVAVNSTPADGAGIGGSGSNGLVYFGTGPWAGDGHACGVGGTRVCSQGALWSITHTGTHFDWHQEPAPPVFPGAGTHSGAVAVVAQPRVGSKYLLFFMDSDTVDVTAGPAFDPPLAPPRRPEHRRALPDVRRCELR